jgi:hypothetical protein
MSSNPRRDELKALSQGLAVLKKQGAIETINEALVQMYSDNGFKELKSLYQWNQLGRLIKQGEKALLLWGRPRGKKREPVAAGSSSQDQEDEYSFFPLAYVFDITQTREK